MAERSQYNERYSFQDPSRSASRSTRYRARKRAKDDQSVGGDLDIHTVSEIEGESEQLEEFATRVSEASTSYHEGIPDDDSCDQPHVLECEILGNDEYHVGVSDSDEENEQSGPGCGASSSTCTLPVSTDDRPLYDGAPLTVSASGILIMQYKMRHKLTSESVADLLELLRLHCPTPNYCIPSMYHFKKQFRSLAHPIQFHYFCSNCLQSVDELLKVCSNPLCNSDLTEVGARSSFIETDIESQLQVLFERKCTHSRIMFPKVNVFFYLLE